MTETGPTPSPSGRGLPRATPFDPESGALPESLRAHGYPGPGVLLLNAAGDEQWAATAAIALAAAWAGAGRRVVLADLHLEDPLLHDRLGEENTDGVVDIFLYGASLSRSARPLRAHDFFLLPAGTYTADPAQVFEHPRWRKLVAGFEEAEATILLFVPAGSPGLDRLAEWAPNVVVLGEREVSDLSPGARVLGVVAPAAALADRGAADSASGGAAGTGGDSPSEPVGDLLPEPADDLALDPVMDPNAPVRHEEDPRAGVDLGLDLEPAFGAEPALDSEPVFDPDADLELVTPAEGSSPRDEVRYDPAADRGPGADRFDVTAEAAPAAPARTRNTFSPAGMEEPAETAPRAGATATEEPVMFVPPAESPEARRDRRVRRQRISRMTTVLLVVAVLAALVAVAGYLLTLHNPELLGGSRGPAVEQEVVPEETSSAPAPPPTPSGTALPYTVFVKAFPTLEAAEAFARTEGDARAGIPFYVVPEERQSVIYYIVMAGLPTDEDGALRLREQLVAAGTILPEDAGGESALLQTRPLTFDLGEFGSREEAAAMDDSLAARGVPAYAVAVPYSDGTERWRLYGGAYADSTRAESMRQLLDRAGLPARLTDRTGRGTAT